MQQLGGKKHVEIRWPCSKCSNKFIRWKYARHAVPLLLAICNGNKSSPCQPHWLVFLPYTALCLRLWVFAHRLDRTHRSSICPCLEQIVLRRRRRFPAILYVPYLLELPKYMAQLARRCPGMRGTVWRCTFALSSLLRRYTLSITMAAPVVRIARQSCDRSLDRCSNLGFALLQSGPLVVLSSLQALCPSPISRHWEMCRGWEGFPNIFGGADFCLLPTHTSTMP